MKRISLLLGGMLMMTAPAHANLVSKISSSVQLSVEGPAVQSTRLGSSYSVSGDNIAVTTLGGDRKSVV